MRDSKTLVCGKNKVSLCDTSRASGCIAKATSGTSRTYRMRYTDMSSMIETLIAEMIAYDAGDAPRIQHFIKVHDFSRTIGVLEGLDEETLFTLEAAAVVHDIGIHISEEKYGSCAGPYQELEGPPIAGEMLTRLGFPEEVTARVCYLVGHHHTYSGIDGIDYQILVEADFLVNLFEDNSPQSAVEHALKTIFKTETGKRFCKEMLLPVSL